MIELRSPVSGETGPALRLIELCWFGGAGGGNLLRLRP